MGILHGVSDSREIKRGWPSSKTQNCKISKLHRYSVHPPMVLLKMMFLFRKWNMLVLYWVACSVPTQRVFAWLFQVKVMPCKGFLLKFSRSQSVGHIRPPGNESICARAKVVAVWGIVILPSIGNPSNEYINPTIGLMTIPLHANNGSLDPSTYPTKVGKAVKIHHLHKCLSLVIRIYC